ncbi:hypothetical protein [Nocardioides taihuensis]|uniref:Uncharacterized protein n=1 Tax=Nocardioides taihuensis TaxID=1835606 RepID=A0ABW0BHE5_9ACTN
MSTRRALAWTLVLTTIGTLAVALVCAWVMYAFITLLLPFVPPLFGPWPEPPGFWASVLADPGFVLGPAVPWWVAGCVASAALLLWRRAGSTPFARQSAFRQGLVASTSTLAVGLVVLAAVVWLGA